jgi:hypothetical protein
MKADLTRLTFQTNKHYRSVRMQQGRVQLDADWNEQQDILNHRIETETVDTLGHAAVPLADAGFGLAAAGKNLTISAGRLYVEGLLCENPAQVTVTGQPDFPSSASPILRPGATLIPLPPPNSPANNAIVVYDGSGAAVDPPDGVYLAYLEVWQRHLTALEDTQIREVALGGPDSTTREKTVWQVKLLRAGNPGAGLNCASTVAAWDALTAAPTGKLAARAQSTAPPSGPCELSPEAGFRGLENQLYRVEIHDDGSDTALRFKWSRNNGFWETRVLKWLNNPAVDECEVASIGKDAYLAIVPDSWLEFFDDTHELLGRSGTLVKVKKTAGNVVTLDLATKTGSLDEPLFKANPRVRVWEKFAPLVPAPVGDATGWVTLEGGIEVKFAPGSYRVGDYWTIPARTASAAIEWPQDGMDPRFVAPQGVLRAFCKLGLAGVVAGEWDAPSDCRQLFPALSELRNLFYVGGDGQQIPPDLTGAAGKNVLPSALEVGVFNGQFPVFKAQVQYVASHGSFPNGTQTEIVESGPDGIAGIKWTLNPTVLDQTVEATLLMNGAAAAGRYNRIHFSARLARASEVAYDPSACVELNTMGAITVQAALDALCELSHKGQGGCCVTVGEGGQYPRLDVALQDLREKGMRRICVCLLPGTTPWEGRFDPRAGDGLTIQVHGAGRGSRIMLRGAPLDFGDLLALEMRDFDIVGTQEPATVAVRSASELRLHNLHIGGVSVAGTSLVQLTECGEISIEACHLVTYVDKAAEVFDLVISKIPLLAPFKAALQTDDGAVVLPISPQIIAELASYDEGRRKELVTSISRFIRESSGSQGLIDTLRELEETAQAVGRNAGAAALHLRLEELREAMRRSAGGFALMLGDTNAPTLLADCQIAGRLSINGESFDETSVADDSLLVLARRLATGQGSLQPNGQLRLRNNQLREIRYGSKWWRQALQSPRVDCFDTIVVEANTISGPTTQLIGVNLALLANFLRPHSDVGWMFANQAKYLGNSARNDFRVWNIGNGAEAFGNGALNIVAGL